MARACMNCDFAHETKHEIYSDEPFESAYECRRYAPRPLPEDQATHEWPTVMPDDWCGEFAAREHAALELSKT
jgi:hypothetical protein